MPITPTVTVIGLTTAGGTLANIVDKDEGVGWRPGATRLLGLTDMFLDNLGNPNVGKAFACLQFDFGAAVRVPLMLVQTQTEFTLGDCMLLASDNPATVPTNVVQTGDINLGIFPRFQLNAGKVLANLMKSQDLSKRYLRMVFHQTGIQATPDGIPDETGGSTARSRWFDSGAGDFEVPDLGVAYDLFAEGWGAGASGGESSTAANGEQSSIAFDFTVVIASGGDKSAITTPNTTGTPAAGGVATGGNVANVTGGAGGLPTPLSGEGGYSGKGGDSPNGGAGGPPAYSASVGGYRTGPDGAGPGGGGAGRIVFNPSGGGSWEKYPGGGAGGYFKHKLRVSDSGDVLIGDLIGWDVGDGGVSTQFNGRGGQGRIKFSW